MNIDYTKIKNIEDLKKIGNFSEIKQDIKVKIEPLKISAKSYKELLTIILYLTEKHIDFKKNIFTSKNNEYIFYLTELEGEKLLNKLNIKDEYYEDKALAKIWYKKISKYVHPDKNNNSKISNVAFNVLNNIYIVLQDND